MLSWFVGSRDEQSAAQFIGDVASRLTNKVQMTTDGLKLYLNATEGAFGGDINYAMLTKLYGASGNDASAETRYSPEHQTDPLPGRSRPRSQGGENRQVLT